MQNKTSDEIIGILMDGALLAQYPRRGDRMNWPRGFAATIKLKKGFPAVGSSCYDK